MFMKFNMHYLEVIFNAHVANDADVRSAFSNDLNTSIGEMSHSNA